MSAGYPNVVIHHGDGNGGFGEGQRVVWVERNLRNRPIKAFEISPSPLSVINCEIKGSPADDYPCTARFRLPLERADEGWRDEVNNFDRLEAANEETRVAMLWSEPAISLRDGPC